MSQVELSENITDYVLERFDDFIKEFRAKKRSNKQDILEKWIETPVEGKETTNAVNEHDVIH
ncbi:MAG: hypothetical protein ACTSP4_10580 [Candidatus Hodarchaeales archaeon]